MHKLLSKSLRLFLTLTALYSRAPPYGSRRDTRSERRRRRTLSKSPLDAAHLMPATILPCAASDRLVNV